MMPRIKTCLFLLCLAGFSFASSVSAQNFTPTSGTQSWNTAGNWSTGSVPNGVGASANLPAGGMTVNLNAATTAGSITFTNNGAVLTLANGTGGSLRMESSSGNATISIDGTSTTTNNVTISAALTLASDLEVTVLNTAVTGSGAGTFTGTITGSGDFIKQGPGRLSSTTTAKAYTGATIIQEGRIRFTATGVANSTSSISVSSGGMLMLDSSNGAFNFGSASISLNGAGTAEASQGAGALRNQGSGASTLANAVSLASAATIHVDGGSSSLALNGALSGSSTLTKSGGGNLIYNAAHASLSGGTVVTNGTITVNSLSTLGTGELSFLQSTGNNTAVTLNNSTQTLSSLKSSFTDTTGTASQTLTLTGTQLTLDQSTDTTFGVGAVSTLTSTITGTGSIIKNGTGRLTLTGSNTYSGGTTISAGSVHFSNNSGSATGSGSVTLDTAASLSGTGRIIAGSGNNISVSGQLFVGDQALVLPTAAVATLGTSGAGSTSFQNTSQLRLDIISGAGLGDRSADPTAADILLVQGALNLASGSTLRLSNPNNLTGWADGDIFRLFDWSSLSSLTGSFTVDAAELSLPMGLTVDTSSLYTAGTLRLVNSAIPEPSRVTLLLLSAGALLSRRRRG